MLSMLVTAPAAAARPDNRAVIERFADLFYRQKDVKCAFDRYVARDYIQHNPGIADGRDAAIAALTPMIGDPARKFTVERILVDGDLAAIHIRVTTPLAARGAAAADFYRLKDGKIVEHWDVLQVMPPTSANPHPMF